MCEPVESDEPNTSSVVVSPDMTQRQVVASILASTTHLGNY